MGLIPDEDSTRHQRVDPLAITRKKFTQQQTPNTAKKVFEEKKYIYILQVNILDEYRHKTSPQNISKPNPTTAEKDDIPQPSQDSSRVNKDGSPYANQCNTPYKQKKC